MRTDEYLDRVCSQVRWKETRNPVREEMKAHILQRVDEYVAASDTRESAEEKAVANMGDAERTGRELNSLHRPKYDWALIGALAGLLALGMLFTARIGDSAGAGSSYAATISGLAVLFLIAFGDIRKLIGKKPVYLSIYFGSLVLIAFRYFIADHMHASSLLLEKFPIICPVAMTLSCGMWIKDIKTYKGLALFLFAVTAGALSLLLLPASTLAVTFLICVWAMLWAVKVKYKTWLLAVLAPIVILCLVWYIIRDPYRLERLTGVFTDPHGAGFIFWQARNGISRLNWFGPGFIAPGDVISNADFNEYALLHFMWDYGIAAGLAVVGLCGVVLWRIYKMLSEIHDLLGRTVALGLNTFITMQIVWNVLMNFGIVPNLLPSFIPMFSQVWSQTLVLGGTLGLMIGLYRRKDLYASGGSPAAGLPG